MKSFLNSKSCEYYYEKQKNTERMVKIFYGLRVIFQTGKNILNIYILNYLNEQEKIALMQTKWGVLQDSILGPLLFLMYINDLVRVSMDLTPVMFSDETNLFCFHKNVKIPCGNVNKELKIISQWFKANRHSLKMHSQD